MTIFVKHHLSSLKRVTLDVSENLQTRKQTFQPLLPGLMYFSISYPHHSTPSNTG